MSFFTSFTAVHGDITDVSAIEACYVVMGARGARNRLQGFMASVVFASGYWWRPQQYPFSCASPYLLLPELTIREKNFTEALLRCCTGTQSLSLADVGFCSSIVAYFLFLSQPCSLLIHDDIAHWNLYSLLVRFRLYGQFF